MLKKITFFTMLFSLLVNLYSRDVDVSKLEKFLDADLEFINFKGTLEFVNTYEEILNIGKHLGKSLENANSKTSYHDKYGILRFINDEDNKANADIFIIDSKSKLDSIRNLRNILTGYLMSAFSYPLESARLIAKVITIYNAVYRGDMDFLTSTYIKEAASSVNVENAGLARVYSQWAGQTKMFIPLTKVSILNDGIKDVDVDLLITDKVLATLLEDEEGGVESTQQVTDFQSEKNISTQDEIDRQKETLNGEREDTRKEIDKLKDILEKATDDEKSSLEKDIKERQEKSQDLEVKANVLEKEQEKLDTKEKNLDTQREKVSGELQKQVDDKNVEKGREAPKEVDSKKEINSGTASSTISSNEGEESPLIIKNDYVTFLELLDPNSLFGNLKIIDLNTGEEREEEEGGIRRFSLFEREDDIIVIKLKGEDAVLQILDKYDTLNIKSQTLLPVNVNSSLYVDANMILAVVFENGWKLAKFNSNDLMDFIISKIEVLPFTSFSVKESKIFLQNADGNLSVLNTQDLKEL